MDEKGKEFSLFDFCKKRTNKVQIFGEESLDAEGNIIPFIEQAALVTHYLQLHNTNISLSYTQKAEDILQLWYEFVCGKKRKIPKEGVVAEADNAMQMYLFPDLFKAPFQAPENPTFTFIDLFAGIGRWGF